MQFVRCEVLVTAPMLKSYYYLEISVFTSGKKKSKFPGAAASEKNNRKEIP